MKMRRYGISKNDLRKIYRPRYNDPNNQGETPYTLRTNVTLQPRYKARLQLITETFERYPDRYYLHLSTVTGDITRLYDNYLDVFRKLNNSVYRRLRTAGFRMCNIVPIHGNYRLNSDIATVGSTHAALLFSRILPLLTTHAHFRVYFNAQRTKQQKSNANYRYTRFMADSNLLHKDFKVEVIECDCWEVRITKVKDVRYIVQIMFDLFDQEIDSISTDYADGLSISRSCTIDEDDYKCIDLPIPDPTIPRIRSFQPFGSFIKFVK